MENCNKVQFLWLEGGGSGKTMLVAKTYKNEIVKCHFDCYAWITVSQKELDQRIPPVKGG
ncbi:conserved hypothetical protein [Ricinus communis]|uniref:NB-ARC domain-containing protein n=1 Tax=Ricinus communis TaxID=3988 RepID=B9SHR1_RICCO|nr:conserved hypothetical protein [Ricinus communis]